MVEGERAAASVRPPEVQVDSGGRDDSVRHLDIESGIVDVKLANDTLQVRSANLELRSVR